MQDSGDNLPDLSSNHLRGGVSINQADARGLPFRKRMVCLSDSPVELDRLFVDSRFAISGADQVAMMGSGQSGLCIDVDDERQIGFQSMARNSIDRHNGVDTQLPAGTLVGNR